MLWLFKFLSYSLPFTLFLSVGAVFTLKGKFFQIGALLRSFPLTVKAFLRRKHQGKGLTSFGAACTAISATVGTGNIAGVAAAISLGGAGAVFWMWVTAFLGFAIKYFEIYFAVKYREKQKDAFMGGPMFYVKYAFKKGAKPVGILFAVVGVFSAFTTGNLTQANAVVSLVGGTNNRLCLGFALAVFTLFVVLGGAKKICAFTEKAVPLMAMAYTALTLGAVFVNIKAVPNVLGLIFKGVLNPTAVTGGAVGSLFISFSNGAAKGVFSNEAGLGTSAIAHAAAEDANCETQGLFGVFEVFLDTMFICTLTSLTILLSGVNIEYGKAASSDLVASALETVYGNGSYYLLFLMMAIFGFSSIIGWSLYGANFTEYLLGKKAKKVFCVIYPAFCIIGALGSVDITFKLSEFCTGLMLIINLPIILVLYLKNLGSENYALKNKQNKRNVVCESSRNCNRL